MYIFGGEKWGYFMNDVWILDPISLKWIDSSISRYPLPRSQPALIALSDFEFLMFGGNLGDEAGKKINDLWKFDTRRKEWTVLSRESDCQELDSSCMPAVESPAVGYLNGILYVIGGKSSNASNGIPICRKFDLETKAWSILQISSNFINDAGRTFGSAFASDPPFLYLWAGKNVSNGRFRNRLAIFNMENSTSSLIASNADWPKVRTGSSAFIWNSQFCIYGGQTSQGNLVPDEIWCFERSSRKWTLLQNSASGQKSRTASTVQVHGAPFVIGGDQEDLQESFMVLFYNQTWNEYLDHFARPFNAQKISSVKLSSRIYITSGGHLSYNQPSQALYSFDFANAYCSKFTLIEDRKGTIKDGSEDIGYLPSTKCSWEFQGVNFIKISAIKMLQKSALILELLDSCDESMVLDGMKHDNLMLKNEYLNKVIYLPSRRFRIRFEVEDDAPMGDGFEIAYYNCRDGFSFNGTDCDCQNTNFINFEGNCIPCPESTLRDENDEGRCILKADDFSMKSITTTSQKGMCSIFGAKIKLTNKLQ
eukprot:TRINITY_DN2457_c0_g1_i15.p2 TRINITY_DN2457_c0_g1~~TRINITY_DN2457_c0_g1_i15.p2  ORF type:complete len:536 (+),score=111.64 TRINITY_DN2457_c0_g1_i15:1089-2696(+)